MNAPASILSPSTTPTDGEFFEYLFRVLDYYANPSSYEGERAGGVLQGCPRRPAPSSASLTIEAERAKELLRAWYAKRVEAPVSPAARAALPLRVVRRPLLIPGLMGTGTDGSEYVILIDSEQSEHQQSVTLWHELLHLVRAAEGLPHDENEIEAQANIVADALADKQASQDSAPTLRALQTAVRFILASADKFEWSLQGMGMLRLYMGNTRLHIWDQSYAAPDVSMIHDHLQWGLRSTIVAGEMVNQRYIEAADDDGARPFNRVTLKAGYGCQFMEQPQPTRLLPLSPERYGPGDSYQQLPAEIHESKPEGVVVTLMEKFPTGSDLARVFWPAGSEWGSAEPRKATAAEVSAITAKALVAIDAALSGRGA